MDAAMFERHTEHVDPPLEHSVGLEPNQDSATPGRSASATPGRHKTPGSGSRIARLTRMCTRPRVRRPAALRTSGLDRGRSAASQSSRGHQAAGTPSGRASSAPPGGCRARGADQVEALDGERRPAPSSAAASSQASPSGPGEQREAGPEQVERRDEPGGPGSQTCAMRPPRSTWSSRRRPGRAVRVGRARHVVLDDRPALALVGVQQRRSAQPRSTQPSFQPRS